MDERFLLLKVSSRRDFPRGGGRCGEGMRRSFFSLQDTSQEAMGNEFTVLIGVGTSRIEE